MNIMKHVDVLDLIKINVFRPNVYQPGQLEVSLEALEKDKVVVIDEDELKRLNELLTDKCREFEDARDPKVTKYIEEFVARMCSEWHRLGLLEIEEVPEGSKDPYQDAKEMFKHVK
jgi:hypothetical protein